MFGVVFLLFMEKVGLGNSNSYAVKLAIAPLYGCNDNLSNVQYLTELKSRICVQLETAWP